MFRKNNEKYLPICKITCLLFVILFPFSIITAQQYTRWSANIIAGVPLTMNSFSPSLSYLGGVKIKYNVTKELSVQGHFAYGSIAGTNSNLNSDASKAYVDKGDLGNYRGFNTTYLQFSLIGELDLTRVLHLRRFSFFNRQNIYLYGGAGKLMASSTTHRIDGTDNTYDNIIYFNMFGGLMIKYYLNPQLDIIYGMDYNTTETIFLDAFWGNPSYDKYLTPYVGVSYKFGSRKDKQHIEWNNVILKDRIYIPDIEKRMGQPVDLAGDYFIFHKDSIAKLQAANVKLEAKSTELETKNTEQQKQIDSMQKEVAVIKAALDTLQNKKVEVVVEKPVEQKPEEQNPVVTPTVGAKNLEVAKLKTENKDLKQTVVKKQKQIDSLEKEVKVLKKAKPEIKYTIPLENTKENAPNKEIKERNDKPISGTIPSNTLTNGLNSIDNSVSPLARYNIIAGSYAGEKYALIFRNKMRGKGYNAAVFVSGTKMHRVCIFTSEDKNESLQMLRKVRVEIEKDAWIHVYSK